MSVAELRAYTADEALDKLLERLHATRLPADGAQILSALLLHRDLERIAEAIEGMAEKQRGVDVTAGLDALIESLKDTGGPK